MALEVPAVHAVGGFRFAAAAAGLRRDGRLDLGLIVNDGDATAAGVFTRNRVRAAPVELSMRRVVGGRCRAVLANSGGANACTGEAGMRSAEATSGAVARSLGVPEAEVLVASTGVIGQLLPAERVVAVVPDLVAGARADRAGEFAVAICTTDRWTKVVQRSLPGGARLLVLGKGAGMIHPDLASPEELGAPHATMLAFACTDARVSPAVLARTLREASERTLSSASVDGDTSTNDTVLALASGAAGVEAAEGAWRESLEDALRALARELVRDGEGAKHVVRIVISGLSDDAAARRIAGTVATSVLVKTALAGRDANWGRLLAAAGRAGVPFDPAHASIRVGGIEIVRGGVAVGAGAEAEAQRRMGAPEYDIELHLGSGVGRAAMLTCDLGHEYVDVNASYRS